MTTPLGVLGCEEKSLHGQGLNFQAVQFSVVSPSNFCEGKEPK